MCDKVDFTTLFHEELKRTLGPRATQRVHWIVKIKFIRWILPAAMHWLLTNNIDVKDYTEYTTCVPCIVFYVDKHPAIDVPIRETKIGDSIVVYWRAL